MGVQTKAQRESTHTRQLAGHVKSLTYEELGAATVLQAKNVILDTLGVLLAASSPQYKASKAIIGFVRSMGGMQEAVVAGTDLKTSCVNAALANGTMADNIELDDSHPLSGAHVAAVVVPAAMAVAERQAADGKTLITSVVLGYDVDVRVVLAMNPSSLYSRGFHPSAIGGCFGATAAAGKLLGLSQTELAKAFGLAGSQASGLMAWENDPTQMPKSLQMGIAARNGVTAALLAGQGFSGPEAILEGRYGVLGAFSDDPRVKELSSDLGVRYEINLTGLKKYACCRFLHASLDALLQLLTEHNLSVGDISQIVVRVPVAGAPIIDNNELLSHNAQYIMPLAARDRTIMPEHIFQDHRSDPDVVRLSGHVSVVGDPELSKVFPGRFSEPAIVQVATGDGRRFAARSDYASGDPEKRLSPEEVDEKFTRLAGGVVGAERAREIMALVNGLEDVPDVRDVADHLRL